MTLKSQKEIRESILEDYKKQFPGERPYSKVFSIYLLDKYTRLVSRLYKKAEEAKKRNAE